MVDEALWAIIAGVILGMILAMSRPHMTARATFVFMMLYYFLFTGLKNIERLVAGDATAIHPGLARAMIFAVSAMIVVESYRYIRRKRISKYIEELNEKVQNQ